ncbi:MAG: nuclear transport factor 2 family protein, partial [Frankia sp.]
GDDWFFVRRQQEHWYSTDVLERPHAPDFQHWPGHEQARARLPHMLPTWELFWAGDARVSDLTDAP